MLHRDGGFCGRSAEAEANRFAAAFLMPKDTILQDLPRVPALSLLLGLKPKWRVSAAALLKRGQDLGRYTEWQAKQVWIEMSKRRWRTNEPRQLPHEESKLFGEKLPALFEQRGQSLLSVARELDLPLADFEELVRYRERPVQRGHLTVHRGGQQ